MKESFVQKGEEVIWGFVFKDEKLKNKILNKQTLKSLGDKEDITRIDYNLNKKIEYKNPTTLRIDGFYLKEFLKMLNTFDKENRIIKIFIEKDKPLKIEHSDFDFFLAGLRLQDDEVKP